MHILVYFGRVNLEVDYLCLTGVGLEIAGDTVVKAHAHRDEQVTLIGEHIGAKVAVHTKHALVERMVGG